MYIENGKTARFVAIGSIFVISLTAMAALMIMTYMAAHAVKI